jgi:hypothetical protein
MNKIKELINWYPPIGLIFVLAIISLMIIWIVWIGISILV